MVRSAVATRSSCVQVLAVRDLALQLLPALSLVVLGPVLLAQGRRVRRLTPRLPPAMQHFPALPWPLRQVLGLRAHILDRAAVEWARARPSVVHVPFPVAERTEIPEMFCADGFHPSAMGYAQWGAALAEAAATPFRSAPRKHDAEDHSDLIS